jgi:hypothetical protein
MSIKRGDARGFQKVINKRSVCKTVEPASCCGAEAGTGHVRVANELPWIGISKRRAVQSEAVYVATLQLCHACQLCAHTARATLWWQTDSSPTDLFVSFVHVWPRVLLRIREVPSSDLWPASFLTEMFVLYTSPCKNTIWEKNGKFVSVLKKHPTPRRGNECRDCLVNTPASYSGGSGFKSQHENRQKWLRSLWFFSVPPGKCWDSTLL